MDTLTLHFTQSTVSVCDSMTPVQIEHKPLSEVRCARFGGNQLSHTLSLFLLHQFSIFGLDASQVAYWPGEWVSVEMIVEMSQPSHSGLFLHCGVRMRL